jgi:hypothetical protein
MDLPIATKSFVPSVATRTRRESRHPADIAAAMTGNHRLASSELDGGFAMRIGFYGTV